MKDSNYEANEVSIKHVKALDLPLSAFMSVYCNCGRIVTLDRSKMRLKLDLGKELQCMSCRNARISQEIDSINDHFDIDIYKNHSHRL